MKKIGLLAIDSEYPNLALMKISAYHKANGDMVEWYNQLSSYDVVYASKIFSFSDDYEYYINAKRVIKGGTGYDIHVKLSPNIDRIQPDYSVYPFIDDRTAYGFLTRGCPNHCKWCVVPEKEGDISPYMDVDEIAIGGRNRLILMDNNILASDYGLSQIEKIVRRRYHVDFNQGLDARLVTDDVARLLAKVKWIKRIRFGCDTPAQIVHCADAIDKIAGYGYRGEFFLYCILMDDINEAYERISIWKKFHYGKVYPYAQPYRDPAKDTAIIPAWQKDMARWCDRKELWKTLDFKDYEPRKGFRCEKYFNQHEEKKDKSPADGGRT